MKISLFFLFIVAIFIGCKQVNYDSLVDTTTLISSVNLETQANGEAKTKIKVALLVESKSMKWLKNDVVFNISSDKGTFYFTNGTQVLPTTRLKYNIDSLYFVAERVNETSLIPISIKALDVSDNDKVVFEKIVSININPSNIAYVLVPENASTPISIPNLNGNTDLNNVDVVQEFKIYSSAPIENLTYNVEILGDFKNIIDLLPSAKYNDFKISSSTVGKGIISQSQKNESEDKDYSIYPYVAYLYVPYVTKNLYTGNNLFIQITTDGVNTDNDKTEKKILLQVVPTKFEFSFLDKETKNRVLQEISLPFGPGYLPASLYNRSVKISYSFTDNKYKDSFDIKLSNDATWWDGTERNMTYGEYANIKNMVYQHRGNNSVEIKFHVSSPLISNATQDTLVTHTFTPIVTEPVINIELLPRNLYNNATNRYELQINYKQIRDILQYYSGLATTVDDANSAVTYGINITSTNIEVTNNLSYFYLQNSGLLSEQVSKVSGQYTPLITNQKNGFSTLQVNFSNPTLQNSQKKINYEIKRFYDGKKYIGSIDFTVQDTGLDISVYDLNELNIPLNNENHTTSGNNSMNLDGIIYYQININVPSGVSPNNYVYWVTADGDKEDGGDGHLTTLPAYREYNGSAITKWEYNKKKRFTNSTEWIGFYEQVANNRSGGKRNLKNIVVHIGKLDNSGNLMNEVTRRLGNHKVNYVSAKGTLTTAVKQELYTDRISTNRTTITYRLYVTQNTFSGNINSSTLVYSPVSSSVNTAYSQMLYYNFGGDITEYPLSENFYARVTDANTGEIIITNLFALRGNKYSQTVNGNSNTNPPVISNSN